MRTSSSSTPNLDSCPWPTLERILMAPSFSLRRWSLVGLIMPTLCSVRSPLCSLIGSVSHCEINRRSCRGAGCCKEGRILWFTEWKDVEEDHHFQVRHSLKADLFLEASTTCSLDWGTKRATRYFVNICQTKLFLYCCLVFPVFLANLD